MMYMGYSQSEDRFVTGSLFKKDGEFFIVTDEVDDIGYKKVYDIDPKTIECYGSKEDSPTHDSRP